MSKAMRSFHDAITRRAFDLTRHRHACSCWCGAPLWQSGHLCSKLLALLCFGSRWDPRATHACCGDSMSVSLERARTKELQPYHQDRSVGIPMPTLALRAPFRLPLLPGLKQPEQLEI